MVLKLRAKKRLLWINKDLCTYLVWYCCTKSNNIFTLCFDSNFIILLQWLCAITSGKALEQPNYQIHSDKVLIPCHCEGLLQWRVGIPTSTRCCSFSSMKCWRAILDTSPKYLFPRPPRPLLSANCDPLAWFSHFRWRSSFWLPWFFFKGQWLMLTLESWWFTSSLALNCKWMGLVSDDPS